MTTTRLQKLVINNSSESKRYIIAPVNKLLSLTAQTTSHPIIKKDQLCVFYYELY